MQKFTLDEARRIALNCAKQYDKNLNNQNYLILYKEQETKQIHFIEIQFGPENFQHLTGIELLDSQKNVRKNVSKLFFNKCLKNTLRKDEIQLKTDGTTHLKLSALPTLINIHKITKIAGDYNGTRPYLIADKIVGNVNFCLGLKQCAKHIYVPVSSLLEDIKKLSLHPSQVIAIFSKSINENIYTKIRYVAKGFNLNTLPLSNSILTKINLEKYVSK